MITNGTAAPIIRGRLLPYLHLRLSEILPTRGSVIASHKVPNEIIDNIAEGEIVTFNVYINSYANNGQAYLSLTFKDLLQGVAT